MTDVLGKRGNGLVAIGQLIRWPNIVIMIMTQLLLRYCIIGPFVYENHPDMISPLTDFILLMVVTVLLAAGGYVINDYFDIRIDSINRPEKLVVGKFLTRGNAIKVHMILNGVAILLGFYLAYRIRAVSFGFIFPLISGLLWVYSARYKRVVFWGNFIVSVLTASVILVVWLFEFFWLHLHPEIFAAVIHNLGWVSWIITGFAVFAFLTSMVREIVKDMEDFEGDKQFGCRTIPVVYGCMVSKVIAASLLLVTISLLVWVQLILYRMEMLMAFWYVTCVVQMPAIYLVFKLWRARGKEDFHLLSGLCKLIMVAGLLSMEILLISK